MKVWLEIQRESGIDKRKIDPSNTVGIVEGACPGCGAVPFYVQGTGTHKHSKDVLRANGISKCCGDPVGYIFAKVDTIFGLEEDMNVLNGRARVYGGGLRS